jgi:hypothetical protein
MGRAAGRVRRPRLERRVLPPAPARARVPRALPLRERGAVDGRVRVPVRGGRAAFRVAVHVVHGQRGGVARIRRRCRAARAGHRVSLNHHVGRGRVSDGESQACAPLLGGPVHRRVAAGQLSAEAPRGIRPRRGARGGVVRASRGSSRGAQVAPADVDPDGLCAGVAGGDSGSGPQGRGRRGEGGAEAREWSGGGERRWIMTGMRYGTCYTRYGRVLVI